MIEFIFACIGGVISVIITSVATTGFFVVHPTLAALGCMLLGAIIGFVIRHGGLDDVGDVIGDIID